MREPEKPVSVRQILKENPILLRLFIFFLLMLIVPLFLAWKFDWWNIAN